MADGEQFCDRRPGDQQPDREKQQGELATTEPSFDFKVENRQIALTWKNLREVTIRYYLMDPEFLFSASPFVTQDSGRFSIIKPTRTDTQALPEGKDQLSIPLPGEFTKANVLVEILGAGQRKAQTYHANTLKLTLAENYGRLEVHDDAVGGMARVLIVDVAGEIRGMKGPDGAAAPLFKHHVTWIAEKKAGKWVAHGARAFVTLPAPAAPAR